MKTRKLDKHLHHTSSKIGRQNLTVPRFLSQQAVFQTISQRNFHFDRCTGSYRRNDLYFSFDRSHTLVNASQSKGFTCLCRRRIETTSVVRNRQTNAAILYFKPDPCRSSPAVLDDILQRFLSYPVQTQRNILGQIAGHVFSVEIDLQLMRRGKFTTKTTKSTFKSELGENSRMKFIRNAMNVP